MPEPITTLNGPTWERLIAAWSERERRDVDELDEVRDFVQLVTDNRALANAITDELCETIRKYGKERWDMKLAIDMARKPRRRNAKTKHPSTNR